MSTQHTHKNIVVCLTIVETRDSLSVKAIGGYIWIYNIHTETYRCAPNNLLGC
jgi:hypothetical protein